MRGKLFTGLLTATAVVTLGTVALPVSAASAADRAPVRLVTTTLDPLGRPVITVREASAGSRHLEEAGAEVDGRVHALDATTDGTDPYRARQWDLDTMHVPAARSMSTGAGVTVAVIDTGVDGSHPDLAGQVLTGYDAIAGQAGGNTDPQGHGTHVAGTVAALTGNGIGVSSVAPGVKILPVRVLDANGNGYDSDTAKGIVWAADHGANVINMSLGGTDRSSAISDAVTYARGKGVVVVAAAGNDRAAGSPANYPGADDGVIAVAATDSGDTVAAYSNAGGYVDVAAPGSAILSTYPTALGASGYASMSGTSMATPHVAAVAALLLAAKPGLTPDQVQTALETSAADLGTAGRDDDYGYGRVDAAAALTAVDATPGSTPVSTPQSTPPVVSASVSRRSVTYGSRTSTTFRVSDWADQPASICISVAGGSWACDSVRTSAAGTFTLTRTATASFRARLTAGSASAVTTYTAIGVVSLTRTAKRTLTIRVSGAGGQKLSLQRSAGKRWTTVKTFGATGSRRVTGLVSGGSYRAVLASTSKVSGVTSKTVKA
ncbi:peptidase [Actinoplanes sp. SE50]|uniref:S8 family serine peptidase n=1 Tax=unclassified Actinoplanes TaxID=2626549 RepID=UPI00023EC6C6|nr:MULTISPECIES: S8 family serine peptidase [unclassified Actinoplanes]AEV87601.1 Proprotein convertase subtilisin/kexin type 6 [Actinoplanes sp. SE50/110]ATO86004.1 peptidase [Actinoplanes sp. SE50]SLM03418.1 peptidase [Actinoplanes sp. SE50/110]